jgi:transcriptional regulator with PAS, ATPase and Fis domain
LEYYSVCEGQEDVNLISVTPDTVANRIIEDEARTILDALEKSKLNKKKAADYLGISRTTLWRKMQALKINI